MTFRQGILSSRFFRGGTPGPSANFGPTANTDAFVTKLDPAGAVVYSTFFGGSGAELATDITVDSSGRVYVTGITASADLALVNPVQPEFATTCKDQEKRFGYYVCTYASDAFVAALQSDGSKLLFSTYAECWWCDGLYSAQDSSGRVFVAGGYLFEGLGGPVFVAAIDFDAKPTIADNGVVNAASFLTGPVAPGEIVTIAGLGLGGFIPVHIPWDSGGPRISAAGARILIDGEPAPLMDVEANSVRAVVPYQVAGNSSAQLQVDSRGTLSDPVTLPVNAASPGVFTMNLASGVPGAGLDRGFVYNENGTQNSARDPASRGSTITFFATGEGQTDPPGVDGKIGSEVLPRPLLPVTVRIGGVDAEVSYAGGAPGFIAGLMEVHAKVPDAAAPGDAVPLQVNIGGAASQPGLGMSVR